MARAQGSVIGRRGPPPYYVKPGIHSHNVKRRLANTSNALRNIRALLLLLGLCGVGYYTYATFDAYVYQAYQNWAFDQQISGRRGVTFADYLRERTPFGFLVGTKSPSDATTGAPPEPVRPEQPRPAQGSLLGRLEIKRLNLAAMVREGVDA